MIPILIEPSILSFELATLNENFIDSKAKITKLIEFIRELAIFFNELEKNYLAIALTKEMLQIYGDSIPCEIYQHPAISRLARESFGSRLRTLAKIVHKFGSHELDVSMDINSINIDTELNSQEIYYLWSDLAGLTFSYRLPGLVIKSNRVSLFNKPYIKLVLAHNGEVFTLEVKEDIEQVTRSSCIGVWRFFSNAKMLVDPQIINCSGTGSHTQFYVGKSYSVFKGCS